ncbi:MAG TPA: hypothetical protein VND19_04610 [Acetobacteraceae bacterium]|nr:hypothetical protein [Acetobacteraceae bacterium]
MRSPPTSPAEAYAPDEDRVGPDAPTRNHLPDPIIRLLTRLILLLLELLRAGRSRRTDRSHAWCHMRPDLEPGSTQHVAALIRGAFGNSIAWMCLYNGIGPGHRDWPELSRAILAFGGSLRAFRPGRPAMGLPWWGNPYVMPGLPAEARETPAAGALAAVLERDAPGAAPASAPHAAAAPAPAQMPASWRPPLAHAATGPPTGPPLHWGAPYCCA